MAISINFNIPNKFKLISSFKNRKILGVGKHSSKIILKLHGSTIYQKNIFKSKVPAEIGIKKLINKLYRFKMKKDMEKKIASIVKLNNYRAKRHLIFLPVRGQRTKTNAKTRKHRHVA